MDYRKQKKQTKITTFGTICYRYCNFLCYLGLFIEESSRIDGE